MLDSRLIKCGRHRSNLPPRRFLGLDRWHCHQSVLAGAGPLVRLFIAVPEVFRALYGSMEPTVAENYFRGSMEPTVAENYFQLRTHQSTWNSVIP